MYQFIIKHGFQIERWTLWFKNHNLNHLSWYGTYAIVLLTIRRWTLQYNIVVCVGRCLLKCGLSQNDYTPSLLLFLRIRFGSRFDNGFPEITVCVRNIDALLLQKKTRLGSKYCAGNDLSSCVYVFAMKRPKVISFKWRFLIFFEISMVIYLSITQNSPVFVNL